MKHVVVTLLLMGSLLGVAQKKEMEFLDHHSIAVIKDGVKIHANILMDNKHIRVRNNRYYWSYKGGDIKKIRAGISGNALSGDYTQYYTDNSLHTKGRFKKGLKSKKWRYWYQNGELKAVEKWCHGHRYGRYLQYDEDGCLSEKGWYWRDQKAGRVSYFKKGLLYKTSTYRRGCEVQPQQPVAKEKKPKKSKSETSQSEDK